MISYGDMLDTLEKNEPQNPPSVAEKKGGDSVPEKKDSVPEKKDSEPEKKDGEPENEVDEPEDVI